MDGAYSGTVTVLPKWIGTALLLLNLLTFAVIGFVIVPHQQFIIKRLQEQDELIERNHRLGDENLERIRTNKSAIVEPKSR